MPTKSYFLVILKRLWLLDMNVSHDWFYNKITIHCQYQKTCINVDNCVMWEKTLATYQLMDNNSSIGLNNDQKVLVFALESNIVPIAKANLVKIINNKRLDILDKFAIKLQNNLVINKQSAHIKLERKVIMK